MIENLSINQLKDKCKLNILVVHIYISLILIIPGALLFLIVKGDSEVWGLFAVFVIVILLSFSWSILTSWSRLDHNLEELMDLFPELEEGGFYLGDVDYIDDKLKLLIYGDYLISYADFSYTSLRECSYIYTYRFPQRQRDVASIVCVSAVESKKSFKFFTVNEHLVNELYDYIRDYYDIGIRNDEV